MRNPPGVPRFLLAHRHHADECAVVFAAWKGLDSPLRHSSALASCDSGGHCLWWTVEADDETTARALLPRYVAERTELSRVSEVVIP